MTNPRESFSGSSDQDTNSSLRRASLISELRLLQEDQDFEQVARGDNLNRGSREARIQEVGKNIRTRVLRGETNETVKAKYDEFLNYLARRIEHGSMASAFSVDDLDSVQELVSFVNVVRRMRSRFRFVAARIYANTADKIKSAIALGELVDVSLIPSNPSRDISNVSGEDLLNDTNFCKESVVKYLNENGYERDPLLALYKRNNEANQSTASEQNSQDEIDPNKEKAQQEVIDKIEEIKPDLKKLTDTENKQTFTFLKEGVQFGEGDNLGTKLAKINQFKTKAANYLQVLNKANQGISSAIDLANQFYSTHCSGVSGWWNTPERSALGLDKLKQLIGLHMTETGKSLWESRSKQVLDQLKIVEDQNVDKLNEEKEALEKQIQDKREKLRTEREQLISQKETIDSEFEENKRRIASNLERVRATSESLKGDLMVIYNGLNSEFQDDKDRAQLELAQHPDSDRLMQLLAFARSEGGSIDLAVGLIDQATASTITAMQTVTTFSANAHDNFMLGVDVYDGEIIDGNNALKTLEDSLVQAEDLIEVTLGSEDIPGSLASMRKNYEGNVKQFEGFFRNDGELQVQEPSLLSTLFTAELFGLKGVSIANVLGATLSTVDYVLTLLPRGLSAIGVPGMEEMVEKGFGGYLMEKCTSLVTYKGGMAFIARPIGFLGQMIGGLLARHPGKMDFTDIWYDEQRKNTAWGIADGLNAVVSPSRWSWAGVGSMVTGVSGEMTEDAGFSGWVGNILVGALNIGSMVLKGGGAGAESSTARASARLASVNAARSMLKRIGIVRRLANSADDILRGLPQSLVKNVGDDVAREVAEAIFKHPGDLQGLTIALTEIGQKLPPDQMVKLAKGLPGRRTFGEQFRFTGTRARFGYVFRSGGFWSSWGSSPARLLEKPLAKLSNNERAVLMQYTKRLQRQAYKAAGKTLQKGVDKRKALLTVSSLSDVATGAVIHMADDLGTIGRYVVESVDDASNIVFRNADDASTTVVRTLDQVIARGAVSNVVKQVVDPFVSVTIEAVEQLANRSVVYIDEAGEVFQGVLTRSGDDFVVAGKTIAIADEAAAATLLSVDDITTAGLRSVNTTQRLKALFALTDDQLSRVVASTDDMCKLLETFPDEIVSLATRPSQLDFILSSVPEFFVRNSTTGTIELVEGLSRGLGETTSVGLRNRALNVLKTKDGLVSALKARAQNILSRSLDDMQALSRVDDLLCNLDRVSVTEFARLSQAEVSQLTTRISGQSFVKLYKRLDDAGRGRLMNHFDEVFGSSNASQLNNLTELVDGTPLKARIARRQSMLRGVVNPPNSTLRLINDTLKANKTAVKATNELLEVGTTVYYTERGKLVEATVVASSDQVTRTGRFIIRKGDDIELYLNGVKVPAKNKLNTLTNPVVLIDGVVAPMGRALRLADKIAGITTPLTSFNLNSILNGVGATAADVYPALYRKLLQNGQDVQQFLETLGSRPSHLNDFVEGFRTYVTQAANGRTATLRQRFTRMMLEADNPVVLTAENLNGLGREQLTSLYERYMAQGASRTAKEIVLLEQRMLSVGAMTADSVRPSLLRPLTDRVGLTDRIGGIARASRARARTTRAIEQMQAARILGDIAPEIPRFALGQKAYNAATWCLDNYPGWVTAPFRATRWLGRKTVDVARSGLVRPITPTGGLIVYSILNSERAKTMTEIQIQEVLETVANPDNQAMASYLIQTGDFDSLVASLESIQNEQMGWSTSPRFSSVVNFTGSILTGYPSFSSYETSRTHRANFNFVVHSIHNLDATNTLKQKFEDLGGLLALGGPNLTPAKVYIAKLVTIYAAKNYSEEDTITAFNIWAHQMFLASNISTRANRGSGDPVNQLNIVQGSQTPDNIQFISGDQFVHYSSGVLSFFREGGFAERFKDPTYQRPQTQPRRRRRRRR